MINYLYYKLYGAAKVSSYKEIAEFTAAIFFGTLLASNIFITIGFFSKLDILPFLFRSKEETAFFCFFCMLFTVFYFFFKKRYKDIIKKYSQETETERKRGNAIVAIYVIISFLLLFLVPLM
jgi:NADH:ubiquinone oxidoreductase subunit 5 (subunit L)/multisubunit Na+/H+ antiporter MnhA subunit